jgi:hypothetical protein
LPQRGDVASSACRNLKVIPASNAEIHDEAHTLTALSTFRNPLSNNAQGAEGGAFYDYHQPALYSEQARNLRFFLRDIRGKLDCRDIILMASEEVAPAPKPVRGFAESLQLSMDWLVVVRLALTHRDHNRPVAIRVCNPPRCAL